MGEPTLENRLRVLKYLREAAQTAPGATLLQLEALTEDSIRVWTPREALLAFWSVWAFTDAEAAWHAAEQRADPALLDIVAAALVEKNPRRVLDSPGLIAWHPLGRARLIGQQETPAAADLKEPGMALHWLRSRPFSAAALERVFAVPGMPLDALSRLGLRIAETDRAAMIRLLLSGEPLSEKLESALCAAWYFRCRPEEVGQMLTRLGKTAGDKAKTGDDSGRQSFEDYQLVSLYFSKSVSRWPDSELTAYLSSNTGATTRLVTSPEGTVWKCCFDELADRGPAALLPVLASLPPGVSATLHGGTPEYPVTAENAEVARHLLEAAPAEMHASLLRQYLPLLQAFDFPYAAAQVERVNRELLARSSGVTSHNRVPADGLALDWLRQDSGAATEWLAGRPESVNLSSVVQNWAGQDPEACSAWLNTLPTGEMKDDAIDGLVTGIRWHDSQMAGAWAAQAGSTALREKLVKEVEEVTQAISVTEP